MSGAGLRELLATFTIDVDDAKLTKADAKIDGFINKLRRVGQVAASAFAVHQFAAFFDAQIEGAAHLKDMADRLDVSATSLREFGLVAGAAGVGLDGAATALGRLEQNAGKARSGNKAAGQAFAALGVSAVDAHGKAKPLTDLLPELADGFQKLPDQQRRAQYAMQVFGRTGLQLLPILEQGRGHMAELTEAARQLGNGLGDDFYKNAQAARFEMQRTGYALQSLKDRAVNAALPAIVDLLTGFEHLAVGAIDLDKTSFAVSTGFDALAVLSGVTLAGSLYKLADSFGLVKASSLETLGALFAFAAPAIIVGGLYLLFDDLYTLMKGGHSVIGQTLDQLFGLGTAATFALKLNAALHDTYDLVASVGKVIGHTVGMIGDTVADLSNAGGHYAMSTYYGLLEDEDGAAREGKAGLNSLKEIGSDYSRHSDGAMKAVMGDGGASRTAKLDALLGAGIDPATLLRGQNDPTLNRMTGGGVREPFDMVRHELKLRDPATSVRLRGSDANGGKRERPVVHQVNHNNVTVEAPGGTSPRPFGDAIASGLSDPLEIALRNALNTQNVP